MTRSFYAKIDNLLHQKNFAKVSHIQALCVEAVFVRTKNKTNKHIQLNLCICRTNCREHLLWAPSSPELDDVRAEWSDFA
jgi:hypothetical protein